MRGSTFSSASSAAESAGHRPRFAGPARGALARPARYTVKTTPRQRPDNVKEAVVVARQFDNQRPRVGGGRRRSSDLSARPRAGRRTALVVVKKKNISVGKGEKAASSILVVVYFFYITNDWVSEADFEIVFCCR